ncbi:methionine ABC transporter permease MetI [Photobacterium carnosum]|jgi:D-methionine transport system permease protein|uniref:ABC transporter permease n=1 Tax=Photobacterium iliopiscarium TaxID=56192 RepID=A0A2T3MIU3_9GAMM|nr:MULTISPECIES: methionine ABC transporter permease [Photobacterium]KJG12949.1 methionine ABC transporter permease [Photobacterium iliopiscarium]MCD9538277.1 methionine ABC transporter permease MetI [Photobacterium carnosum]MCD9550093.1 methionine ABC transporter permease MetI [Photobacterium carnosum]MCD9553925.1 methionine ABC transporter permease MetI [Photobacterium carnosum]MCF2162953.1 methionine ABC transporter permease MetI [Photobacterium carnosum]
MSLDAITTWWQSNQRLTELLIEALGQTLTMVLVSGLIGFVIGIPLGVALHLTKKNGLWQNPVLNKILGIVVNIGRSIPFIILLVAIIPFTRFVVGSSIGTAAAIVPLTVGAIPFIARLVEGALLEIPTGLIEAAQAMGATPMQIIAKVLLPEALPGIINAITITLVTLISYSAMAGTVGGGGLGDVGIRYGYQRFDGTVMAITVIMLVILVQLIQSIGDHFVKRVDHR